MVRGQFPRGSNFLGGNWVGGNFARGKLSGEQSSKGELSGGQFSSGKIVLQPNWITAYRFFLFHLTHNYDFNMWHINQSSIRNIFWIGQDTFKTFCVDKSSMQWNSSYSFYANSLIGLFFRNIFSNCWFSFFFCLGFFHEHSRITGLQGRWEGISLTSHCHFHPLHGHLDIGWAITAERSSLHIASSRTRTGNLWFPSSSG